MKRLTVLTGLLVVSLSLTGCITIVREESPSQTSEPVVLPSEAAPSQGDRQACQDVDTLLADAQAAEGDARTVFVALTLFLTDRATYATDPDLKESFQATGRIVAEVVDESDRTGTVSLALMTDMKNAFADLISMCADL